MNRDRMVMFSIALLLFCFSISNPPTRIFVAATSVMVAALIGWCIRTAWESSEERGQWFSRILPHIMRALGNAYDARDDIFPLILRRWISPSQSFVRSGDLQASLDRERGGV